MNSRLIVVGLFVIAGVAILALLITPVVHVPYIVLHGPMSALRAQRAATLFNTMIGAGFFLLLFGLHFAQQDLSATSKQGSTTLGLSSPPHLSCSRRC
jgi:hypothetical protein